MSGLGERLRASLEAEGPMPLSRFMSLALLDRRGGYYATGAPIGAAGDFTTAPEVSQCFGELLGIALARAWLDLDRPARVLLVELGPGRGTLMADLLRAVATLPGLPAALELHLVEPSPALRAVQAARLGGHGPRFHDSLATVPGGCPLLLLANEVLDALPIRQLVRDARGWRERLVALDPSGRLAFALSPTAIPAAFPEAGPEPPPGTVVELGPAREALVAEIARRLAADRGLALLIDYGRLGCVGDSLRAVRAHRPADPLDEPGTVDLSADVDFAALRRAARAAGAAVFGPVPQGTFLGRLGIALRLERLVRGRSPAERAALEAGVHRLVAPEAMGERFKVLALTGPGTPPPAGFLAEEAWPTATERPAGGVASEDPPAAAGVRARGGSSWPATGIPRGERTGHIGASGEGAASSGSAGPRGRAVAGLGGTSSRGGAGGMRLEAALLAVPGVRHGFFGRPGGVSEGVFASLNVGLRSGDDRERVLENRSRAAAALGGTLGMLCVARQVHGTACLRVEEPWDPLAPPEADALVTTRPDILLGVTSADCAPVVLAELAAGVVGAAHAGWRGALAGVLESVVESMVAAGAERARIVAVVGPCIGRRSYEVGPELRALFLERDPASEPFFLESADGGRPRFDLEGYCCARLARSGVGRVQATGRDTLREPEHFFSFRRTTLEGGGPFGLQLSAIRLEG